MVEVAEGVVDAGEEAAEEAEEGTASTEAGVSELLLMLRPPLRPVWAEGEAVGVARI